MSQNKKEVDLERIASEERIQLAWHQAMDTHTQTLTRLEASISVLAAGMERLFRHLVMNGKSGTKDDIDS